MNDINLRCFFLEIFEIVWAQLFIVLRWGTFGLTEAAASVTWENTLLVKGKCGSEMLNKEAKKWKQLYPTFKQFWQYSQVNLILCVLLQPVSPQVRG